MTEAVYLIRHGRPSAEAAGRYIGQTDVPLSRIGAEQIAGMTGHLQRLTGEGGSPGLDAVYCSDLGRARQSAEIIAEALGLRPVAAAQLRERHFGRWEGLTFDEIKTLHYDEFCEWMNNPTGFRPPGGESAEEVRARVLPFFHRIVGRHEGRRIAAVAHGGVNRIILCTLLAIPLDHLFSIEQDYAGLNLLEYSEGKPAVRAINWTWPS